METAIDDMFANNSDLPRTSGCPANEETIEMAVRRLRFITSVIQKAGALTIHVNWRLRIG